MLAIECLEEAKTVDSQSRACFQESISGSAESQDPEIRRPVAEALLHLRLAKMEALDENRFLSGYFTRVEYQLFLDDLQATGQYRQPDHWLTYQFPTAMGSHAVAGVRFSDATAFAQWLSARAAGKFRYRVPRADDEIPPTAGEASPESPGFWLATADGAKIASASARAISARLQAIREARALGHTLDLDRALALDFDHALDRARRLALAVDQLADRNRSVIESKTAGQYLIHDVLCFLDIYSRFTTLQYGVVAEFERRHFKPGMLDRFTQSASAKEHREKLATVSDRCFDLYFACTIDQLQREGKIPILGGIRGVRERFPDAPNSRGF